MYRKITIAALLVSAFATAAPAEQLSGRMLVNSKDAGVLVLKTAGGLLALAHTPDMKIVGAPLFGDLKVCDELAVEATPQGATLAIRTVTVKGPGKAEDCPTPAAAAVPAAELYKALADKSALVVDVRTPAEYARGHFEGALNIPLTEIAGRLQEFQTGKPVIIYCATARRSAFAAAILQEKGIKSSIIKGKFVIKGGKPQIEE